jgi:hypothetical protein
MGMKIWKRLVSLMEELAAPTIQKASAPRENPPIPKSSTDPYISVQP